jgi:sulfite reductase alpha subunit-like flavoprotein
MGKDVMVVLEDMLKEKENKTPEEAKEALNQMEEEKTLIKELWG